MDLSGWIDRQASFAPAKPALRFEGHELTYAAMAARVEDLARGLKHRLGIGRGDRVAFLGYNHPDFLVLLFACARLGAMLVPLNWRLAAPEHAFILDDAQISALLVTAEFARAGAALVADRVDCTGIAVNFDSMEGQGWVTLEELLEVGGDDRNPRVDLTSPLLVVYTSGTTGHPKGAVLRQEALFWNAVNSAHMHDLTSRDHVLTVLPLFHVGGLNIQTTPALHAGATVTLLDRFEPQAVLRRIREDRPSLTVLVPATMQSLIDHPDWAMTDLSCLRMIACGSSVVPQPLLEAFHARGVPAAQVYGATETSPIAVYQRAADAPRKEGSTGKAALHAEMRVVDAGGQDVAPGGRGEILIRGPNVMYEYWGNDAATRDALRDGWFHTGDIGWVDGDGDLWVVDRKKDVVISGGENIYPAELESVLHACPAIRDAVVVGRADARWGEVPVAVVVKAAAELDESAVLALFEGRLARFKYPREVVFLDELPRNAMGKVLRYLVREWIAAGR